MKYFTLRICALFALVCAFSTVRAQSKTGYIDFQQLLSIMPESAAASTQIETFRQSLNSQIATIAAQLDAKTTALQQDQSKIDDASRQTAETEINNLSKQLQQLQSSSQQSIQAKIAEVTNPVIAKAKTAISQVATEGGYTLILNVPQSEVLFTSSDNLLPAVKTKLGIQ